MKRPLFSQWSLRNRLLLTTVVVAAVGIGASDFAANAELRGFLIRQVDGQLSSVAGGTVSRLVRAGIAPSTDDSMMTTEGSPSSTTQSATPEFHPTERGHRHAAAIELAAQAPRRTHRRIANHLSRSSLRSRSRREPRLGRSAAVGRVP